MFVLPHAELDDGQLDVLISKQASKLDLPARAAQGLQGRAPRLAARRVPARRGDRGGARTARSSSTPTATRSAPLRPPCASSGAACASSSRPDVPRPHARSPASRGRPAAGSAARGGTTAPGRLLLRSRPGRAAPHGERARRRVAARLRHERQDDHLGDARRVPGARPGGRSCTTARARTWRGASPRRCSTPAASRGQLGLFEVDEAWLPKVAEQLRAAPAAALEPVPRPARPLRRAGAAGRPLGRAGRRAWTARRASC